MCYKLSAAFTLFLSAVATSLVACSTAPGDESSSTLSANPTAALTDFTRPRSSWHRSDAKIRGLVYVSNGDIFVYRLAGTAKPKRGPQQPIAEIVPPPGPSSPPSSYSAADDMGVDKHGNLWVAHLYDTASSQLASNVLEYSRGASEPENTLNVPDSYFAVDVAIDRHDTVYVLNNASDGNASVTIYPKGATNPKQTLTNPNLDPSNAQGIAVDKKGDIFISYEGYSGSEALNEISEFVRNGSTYVFKNIVSENCSSCAAGDLKIDNAGNLVEAVNAKNQGGAVHVYSPPNWYLTQQLGSSAMSAVGVALSSKDHRIFVSYASASTIELYSYPGGTTINSQPFAGFGGEQRDVAVDP